MSNEPNHSSKRERAEKERRWQRKRQYNNLRFAALSLLSIIGAFVLILAFLILFPRSTVSKIENRNLATFPKFSMTSYFAGEFTADVATWFDDTVPFRDSLKNLGYSFKSLFGFSSKNSITFINQDVVANDMNVAAASPSPTVTPETAAETSAQPSEEPDQKDFTSEDAEFDMTNGLLVVYQDGHWKCLGLFGGGSGESYASGLNLLQEKLGDSVTIYSMPCPLASQFYTPANASDYTTDQSECFEEVAGMLNSKIKTVDLCPVLAKHTEENIYLRTDHHWAPLGAYYAARTFAEAAGVDFADISTYEEGVNEGYVGTMYAYSQDSRILDDPEDFVYYTPTNQYSTYYYDSSFNYEYEYDLIQEVAVDSSYLMFMGGDDKIVKITTDVHNGRKLFVLKDSYGNAEIPFYTSSFEEIYVADMRYFNCNLVTFIQDRGITDVLFTMCSYSVVGSNADNITTLIEQYPDEHLVDEQAEEAKTQEAVPSASPSPSTTPDGTQETATETSPTASSQATDS